MKARNVYVLRMPEIYLINNINVYRYIER